MRIHSAGHYFAGSCRISLLASCLLGLPRMVVQPVAAEPPKIKTVDPRYFGLNIPEGKVIAGGGRRVSTREENGQAVVAKLHASVGEYRIVKLPDGTLAVRKSSESELTERPFEAISKDELEKRLTSVDFRGFKTNQTRRYLYVYNTSENFALVTSRILETMFRGVVQHAQAQRIEVSEPDVPLVALMFRTEDEFQQYRRMPPGVVAYYHVLSNRIVMYEESKLGRIKPELAIQQSISTIAHEGAHQILHNIGVQTRLSVWPMWLAEGLAEYYAPTTFGSRLRWKGAGQVNDLRMFELENYLLSNSNNGLNGDTISATVRAARLTSTGYASAWALTHYLAKSMRPEFNGFVREMSKLGPLEGYYTTRRPGLIPENLEIFKKHFGSDLSELEHRMVLHLKKQHYKPPFAEFPHYLALISYPNGNQQARAANLFISQESALRWIADTVGRLNQEQQRAAKKQIRECANRYRAVQLKQQWLAGR